MTAFSTLVERFDAADPDLWTYSGGATVAAGQLRVTPQEGVGSGASSNYLYDLTGSHVLLELPSVPVGEGQRVVVSLTAQNPDGSTRGLWWSITAGTLQAVRYDGTPGGLGQTDGWSGPHSPTAHRWLKIEETAGSVRWSTSHNGMDWTLRDTMAAVVDTTQLGLFITTLIPEDPAGGYLPPPAGLLLVDNINAPPPPLGGDPVTRIGDGTYPNLAVDVAADRSGRGAFRLDESELDGPDVLGWPISTTDWSNIVCDVMRVSLERGAIRLAGALTRAEAGHLILEVRDTQRLLDPSLNADAIHRGTPVRVRAWAGTDSAAPDWSAVLFTGRIGRVSAVYDQDEAPVVTITAGDRVADLAAWRSAGRDPAVGSGESLLDRVRLVFTEMGESDPDSLLGDVDPNSAYVAGLAPTDLAQPWTAITDAADAEVGQVWVDRDNRLAVRARFSELSGPLRGTLSDVHGEHIGDAVHCCYSAPSVVLDPDLMTNRAIGARRLASGEPGPSAVVQLDDEDSQARHGVSTVEDRALSLSTDDQLAPWCRAILVGATEPELRVETVQPAPWDAPDAWPAVASTDVGDRWLFRLRPALGPMVDRTLGVLGIRHDIDPAGWSVTWTTTHAPAPGQAPGGWFLLDVSELDAGDLLAPF